MAKTKIRCKLSYTVIKIRAGRVRFARARVSSGLTKKQPTYPAYPTATKMSDR